MHNQYPETVRQQAMDMIVEKGMHISEVARQLGVGSRTIYNWLNDVKKTESRTGELLDFLRLKKELNKVTAERDILQDLLLKIAGNKESAPTTINSDS